MQVDLGGVESVVVDNKVVDVMERKPEAGVTDVLEGGGLRLDLEKVPEMEIQNVEKTLQ